jgi:acetyl esterase/lipase
MKSRRTIVATCGSLALLALAMPASDPCTAAEPQIINLWPGTPPGSQATTSGPEQDQTKPEDRLIAGRRIIKLGNVSTPQLHVFLPPSDKATGAAVVVCPGGGFNILAWDLEGTEVAEWLNSLGVAAAVLKYRVPTRNHADRLQAPVMDAQRAISLTRSKAGAWRLDPQRIGILGFSAGGATAGLACTQNGKRLYDPLDDADSAACRPDFGVLIYPGALWDDATGKLRDDVVVSGETPPMFFAHAFDDRVSCENSVALFLALKRAGVASELHVYDRGGHGYGLRPVPEQPVTSWTQRCADWLGARGVLARGS